MNIKFPWICSLRPRVSCHGFVAGLILIAASYIASAATSVSQHGVTWRWLEERQIGQYANGDWWVVGPITITSITPASVTDSGGWTRNGTMVNPAVSYGQGFDSSINGFLGIYYSGAMNVSPSLKGPLTLATGSVVSTISRSSPGTASTRPQITDAAVLTVVSSPPKIGSFRPPFTGTDKNSYWNESQLNYSILRSLTPVTSTPDLATVERWFARPWFTQMDNAPSRYIAPLNNMPDYGRDQAHRVAEGLLSLHLNYSNAEKRNLYVRMVQYGIDIYGALTEGRIYQDNGGINVGRKAPLVLAALALNDSNIGWYANASNFFGFHDDRQHWIVGQRDVGRELYTGDGRPREQYRQEHVGMPEWGERHFSFPQRDGSNWNAYYRWINGGPMTGQILAMRLTAGAEAAWNWPPVFAYIDRYWGIESRNGYSGQSNAFPNCISRFAFDMWTSYRNLAPGAAQGIVTSPERNYKIGDKIKISVQTNVYENYTSTSGLLTVLEAGKIGTITDGPKGPDNQGIVWWQVDFGTGVIGWIDKENIQDKNSSPPVKVAIYPNHANYKEADRIQISEIGVNVYERPTLESRPIGRQNPVARGVVVEAKEADGDVHGNEKLYFYRIEFEKPPSGWVLGSARPVMHLIDGNNQTISPPLGQISMGNPFSVGDRIIAQGAVTLRESHDFGSPIITEIKRGTTGRVIEAPGEKNDLTIWAKVEFENKETGWCLVGVFEAMKTP